MIINPHAVADFKNRRLDSFTWMKRLSRETIERELRQLKVRPVFKTEPWTHQLVCFYIALCQPRFLYLLDMGMGKTKILADIMTQLLRERRLDRALITVPRVINMDSWREDLERHSNLEPWLCDTSNIEEKWERLAYPKGDATIIDLQGLHWAVCDKKKHKGKFRLVKNDKKIRHVQRLYNFVGIDESHKLSSRDNLWFSIMRQLTKTPDYVYATTGTLFGSDPQEAWSQFYLVDRGDTLGENTSLFRAAFFDTKVNQWSGTEFIPKRGMARPFNKMIQHRSIRYDEREVPELELPALVMRRLSAIMGTEQHEHYLRAVDGIITAGGRLSELDAQWIRMRQITSGYLAWKDENGSHTLHFKDNPKLALLERIMEERGKHKVIISCEYTETGRMISKMLDEKRIGHVWYYGGAKQADKSSAREKFMTDPKCEVFLMNSVAGGTGNDGLQKVARYMVLYETPTSPTERKQVIKRGHRPGLKDRLFCYDLTLRNTVDMGILDKVLAGIDFYDEVVNGRVSKSALFDLRPKRVRLTR